MVFPAPDGPTSATIVPGRASNDTPCNTHPDGSSDSSPPPASRLGTDTSDAAGYLNHTSSTRTSPATSTSSTAPGASATAGSRSRTSKTRSNETRAVSRSTRALARSVSGE